MTTERKAGRPDGNRERAAEDRKTALKPNCLPAVLERHFAGKSHLHRGQPIVLPSREELILGPPQPGDRRTVAERWCDLNFWFQGLDGFYP
jgi:hypothetical protein